jgi:hypothetical protein
LHLASSYPGFPWVILGLTTWKEVRNYILHNDTNAMLNFKNMKLGEISDSVEVDNDEE